MLEVIIDTSIYRNNPSRDKAGFNAIVRLAKSGKLHLHIPYIVQKEFLLQEIDIHEKNIQAINSAIIQLQRRVPSDSALSKKIDKIKESFLKIQDDYLAFPESDFVNWINKVQGVVHPVSESHGAQVMDDYFEGKPPFKSKKNRDDIPDSFIWQVISDLANHHERLYAVIHDEQLRDTCNSKPNIVTFKSLDEFIQSDVCRSILEEENVVGNIERLFRYIPVVFDLRQDEIRDQLTESVENTRIHDEILIPNSSHHAKIIVVDDFQEDIEIEDVSVAQYYGDGVVVVLFNARAKITVEYELSPAEYIHLDVKRRTEQISYSEQDEMAEESFALKMAGKISIKVDAQKILEYNLSEEDVKSLIDNAEITVDSVDQKELDNKNLIQYGWDANFLELVRFKEEYGHCEVPRKHRLGYWVSNQRQRKRIGKLTRDRVERLDNIEFVWVARTRDVFDEHYEKLLEYKRLYGHVDVPQHYKKLGRWVNDQRVKKKNGSLPKEHEDQLNKIDFVWNSLEARWNQRFNELREFHERYGHFDVNPQNTEYPKLYSWTVKLRRTRPTPDRLAKLNSIGYDWDVEHKKVEETSWDERLFQLKEYYRANGHFDVNYKENKSLYYWLNKLKNKEPTEERLAKLSSIGFQWEPTISSRQKPLTWDDNFNLFKAYVEANGNFKISSTKQKRLYTWLYNLKRNRPTNEQIEKLKSIGFDWEKEKVV
jgi:hypothetical protein